MSDLKRTPLYDDHVALGAKLVPFAGFKMPVQYATGIRSEHLAVREAAGLFDVSHMGEFKLTGLESADVVSRLVTNDISTLEDGQAQYTAMCHPDGGIVDDLLVYKLGDDDYRLVVNGANLDKDWRHVTEVAAGSEVALHDESDEIALLALQGPAAAAILQPLASIDLDPIGFYRFAEGDVAGVPGIISRTGYTGEDGFELYVAADRASELWNALLAAGQSAGLIPTGLGARDSLRLEMGYALYGNDLDDETSPLEAGLGWLVKLDKGDFVGREVLQGQKGNLTRRLRGFRLTERGFPRPGQQVMYGGEVVGEVRSGTVSPSLGYGIGTAYLPPGARPGDEIAVVIRDKEVAGEVAKMPFYTDGSLRR